MIEIDICKKLLGAKKEMHLDVNFNIKEKDIVALTGESGAGKTTLLRIFAGLEEAKGVIKVDNEIWLDKKFSLPPQKRRIGFVFQEYALFTNMSVEENLLYVNRDKEFCKKLLKMTNLYELKNRSVTKLSGGQKQRVSLCRAMMKRPKLLLMDEPLSALDPKMRTNLQLEILTFHKEFGTTTLLVSHDISEIYKLSNRVIKLHLGKIIADGPPKDILLQMGTNERFSLKGELLEIKNSIAVVVIGGELVEVVVNESEAKELKVGDMMRVKVDTRLIN